MFNEVNIIKNDGIRFIWHLAIIRNIIPANKYFSLFPT